VYIFAHSTLRAPVYVYLPLVFLEFDIISGAIQRGERARRGVAEKEFL
jgi:hypothetical protein